MNSESKCEHRIVKLTGSGVGVLVNCDGCGVRFLPPDHQQAQRLEQAVDALTCDAAVSRDWQGDHWGPEVYCWCGNAFDDEGHSDNCLKKRAALAALTPPAEQPGGTR